MGIRIVHLGVHGYGSALSGANKSIGGRAHVRRAHVSVHMGLVEGRSNLLLGQSRAELDVVLKLKRSSCVESSQVCCRRWRIGSGRRESIVIWSGILVWV